MTQAFYTAENARHAKRLAIAEAPLRIKCLRLADIVAQAYDLPTEDITGKRRFRELIEPRLVLYWLCRSVDERKPWSFPSIARALGRDHSTVMNGFERIDLERRIDAELYTLTQDVLAKSREIS